MSVQADHGFIYRKPGQRQRFELIRICVFTHYDDLDWLQQQSSQGQRVAAGEEPEMLDDAGEGPQRIFRDLAELRLA